VEQHEPTLQTELALVPEPSASSSNSSTDQASERFLWLVIAGHPVSVHVTHARYLTDDGCPTSVLHSEPSGIGTTRRLHSCPSTFWPKPHLGCDAFVRTCMRARGLLEDAIDQSLLGRYVKGGVKGIKAHSAGWALWLTFLTSSKLHPFFFSAANLTNFLTSVRADYSATRVASVSSAIAVVYAQALTINVRKPWMPLSDLDAGQVRKTARVDAPNPEKPQEGIDFAIIRDWLTERGSLRTQSLASLVVSFIVIARVFLGFRAADLATALAHTQTHELDTWTEDSLELSVNIQFYGMKTATIVSKRTYRWADIGIRPLSKVRLRYGLKIRPMLAKSFADSCCFIRALFQLRQRLLPLLVKHFPIVTKGNRKLYTLGLPSIRTDVERCLSGDLRFIFPITSITVNRLLTTKMHLPLFGKVAVDAQRDFIAMWYRHNALSALRLIDCRDYAILISQHVNENTFNSSYSILVSQTFKLRYGALLTLSKFQELSAPERLLL
jgi:hypothetical protein